MILHHEGFPIRKSADRCLFTAPRSLSQLVTSFFGSWCQGIHLMLFFAWTYFLVLSYPLNCLSFFWTFSFGLLIILVKRFISFCLNLFSTFRWNCNLPKFGKTYKFYFWSRKNYLREKRVNRKIYKNRKVQAKKSIRWMPWHREPKKDVTNCDKLRGAVNKLRSADFRIGKPPWWRIKDHYMNQIV